MIWGWDAHCDSRVHEGLFSGSVRDLFIFKTHPLSVLHGYLCSLTASLLNSRQIFGGHPGQKKKKKIPLLFILDGTKALCEVPGMPMDKATWKALPCRAAKLDAGLLLHPVAHPGHPSPVTPPPAAVPSSSLSPPS